MAKNSEQRIQQKKRDNYQSIYTGIESSDEIMSQYSNDVLDTIFSGQIVVGEAPITFTDYDAGEVIKSINDSFYGDSATANHSIILDNIRANKQASYDKTLAREWQAVEENIKEKSPGLHRWLMTDMLKDGRYELKQNQYYMLFGPHIAERRIELSKHIENRELSSRVWLAGQANTNTVQQIVRDAIATGQPAHETYSQLEHFLNPRYAPLVFGTDGTVRKQATSGPNASSAIRRLMRTETAYATGQAEIDAALNIPSVIGVEWAMSSRHADEDGCDENNSIDLYKLGPGVYPADKVPRFPAHPNCVIGSTRVSGSAIRSAYRRWWVGDVVKIATGINDDLTITPNHPVLTLRGWIKAGDLEPGDYLIQSIPSDRMSAAVPNNETTGHPMIEQVFEALSGSDLVSSATVPPAPEQFHGDISDHEVDIVRTDGLLASEVNRVLTQQGAQGYFANAHPDLLSLTGDGSLTFGLEGIGLPPSVLSSTTGHTHPLFVSHLTHHESHSVTRTSNLNSSSHQAVANDTPGNTELSGNRELSHSLLIQSYNFLCTFFGNLPIERFGDASSFEVTRYETFVNSKNLRDVLDSQTSVEHLENLISTTFDSLDLSPVMLIDSRRDHYSGYVYNLETKTHWYSSNNIVTHNCCCVLINVHNDEDEAINDIINQAREEVGLPPLSKDQLADLRKQKDPPKLVSIPRPNPNPKVPLIPQSSDSKKYVLSPQQGEPTRPRVNPDFVDALSKVSSVEHSSPAEVLEMQQRGENKGWSSKISPATDILSDIEVPWSPTKTPQEAAEFAASGVFSETVFFHFTSNMVVEMSKSTGLVPSSTNGLFGHGVYMTSVPSSFLTGAASDADRLNLVTNVKNPLVISDNFVYPTDMKMSDYALQNGYDSLIFDRSPGDDWLIVLDPTNVVIVDENPPTSDYVTTDFVSADPERLFTNTPPIDSKTRAEWNKVARDIYKDDLNRDEKQVVENYATQGRQLNSNMRSGFGYDKNPADSLSEIIRNQGVTVTDQPQLVYRGLKFSPQLDPLLNIAPGALIDDPAFISASLSKAAASRFVDASDYSLNNSYIMTIELPVGHKYYPLEYDGMRYRDYYEAVLDRNTSLEVVSTKKDEVTGITYVTARPYTYQLPERSTTGELTSVAAKNLQKELLNLTPKQQNHLQELDYVMNVAAARKLLDPTNVQEVVTTGHLANAEDDRKTTFVVVRVDEMTQQHVQWNESHYLKTKPDPVTGDLSDNVVLAFYAKGHPSENLVTRYTIDPMETVVPVSLKPGKAPPAYAHPLSKTVHDMYLTDNSERAQRIIEFDQVVSTLTDIGIIEPTADISVYGPFANPEIDDPETIDLYIRTNKDELTDDQATALDKIINNEPFELPNGKKVVLPDTVSLIFGTNDSLAKDQWMMGAMNDQSGLDTKFESRIGRNDAQNGPVLHYVSNSEPISNPKTVDSVTSVDQLMRLDATGRVSNEDLILYSRRLSERPDSIYDAELQKSPLSEKTKKQLESPAPLSVQPAVPNPRRVDNHSIVVIPEVPLAISSRIIKNQWDRIDEYFSNPNSPIFSRTDSLRLSEKILLTEIVNKSRKSPQDKAILTALALKYGIAKPIPGQPVYTGVIRRSDDPKSILVSGTRVDATMYNSPKKSTNIFTQQVSFTPMKDGPQFETFNILEKPRSLLPYLEEAKKEGTTSRVAGKLIHTAVHLWGDKILSHPNVPETEKNIIRLVKNESVYRDPYTSYFAAQAVLAKYNIITPLNGYVKYTGLIEYDPYSGDFFVDGVKSSFESTPGSDPIKKPTTVVETTKPEKPLRADGVAPAIDPVKYKTTSQYNWSDAQITFEDKLASPEAIRAKGRDFALSYDLVTDTLNLFDQIFEPTGQPVNISIDSTIANLFNPESSIAGQYDVNKNELNIAVGSDVSPAQAREIIIHELGHKMFFDMEKDYGTPPDETANSTGPFAYVLQSNNELRQDYDASGNNLNPMSPRMLEYYAEPTEVMTRLFQAYVAVRTNVETEVLTSAGHSQTKYLNWWPRDEFIHYIYPVLDDFLKATGRVK